MSLKVPGPNATYKELQDYILEVFAGGDGGTAFVHFMTNMRSIEAKALEGDLASLQIIGVVRQFCRLVSAMQNIKVV